MKERWFITQKPGDYTKIGEEIGTSPVIARIIRNREHTSHQEMQQYLRASLSDLHSPNLMKDMDLASKIIKEKIAQRKKIRVIGDYDIDGVTSTYILVESLENLAADVDFDIPDRLVNGYGLSMDLIKKALNDSIDTIITCDNGIAAFQEIQYAIQSGITVIVTDHHEVPFEIIEETKEEKQYILPPAHAVIDPKREDCPYPFKELCGAAVAYKFVQSLYQEMNQNPTDLEYLLEAVAIATIGDVMDLVGENRIFVKEGLRRLATTKNLGLASLMAVQEIEPKDLSAYHIGFVIGPCINATGRLDTAMKAVELLREKDHKQALIMATQLTDLNEERKTQTLLGVEQAVTQVEESLSQDVVLVVYLPDCHESLAGIIAGRIREKYYKPALVITDAHDGLKGSARSIEAFDMFEELTKAKDLLSKFGGHKLAAGFSLPTENLEPLRQALNQNHTMSPEDLQPKVAIDLQLPIEYISHSLVEELRILEPFGKANSKPVFVERNLEIGQVQILGKNKNVFKCKLRSGNTVIDGIYFGEIQKLIDTIHKEYGEEAYRRICNRAWAGVTFSIIYYPSINEFRGNKTIQLIIQNFKL